MKDEFEKLYQLQRTNLIYSAWIRKTSLVDRIKNMAEEVQEVYIEAEKKNWQKFEDEIGDVLWDCIGIIAKAEKEGYTTIENVLNHAYKKFTTRKPFLLTKEYITEDEEAELWKMTKEKEKNEQD